MQRNIVLVGFMGTGKSTVGAALAERLGWRMIDTDACVEEREGRPIPELFREKGEAYFRDAEAAVLKEVLAAERQVVSTGGGAVLRQANRETMKSGGFVVALTAAPETLISRLQGDSNRPLLAGNLEERVRRLLEERKDAYGFAHLTIDTSMLPVPEIVEKIVLEAKGAAEK